MTTATKAGGAVLPVVAWCALTQAGSICYFDGRAMVMPGPVGNDCHPHALTAHAPAQATIDELRAEVERLTRELVAAMAEHDDIRQEYAALKAKQIDVEAVMRLADMYARAVLDAVGLQAGEIPELAEREALRACLLGDGGTL